MTMGRLRISFIMPFSLCILFMLPALTVHAVTITEYTIPTGFAVAKGITGGRDGGVWFTEYGPSKIGRINVTTHEFLEYEIPTAYSRPMGITVGTDSTLWFNENNSTNIGRKNILLPIAEYSTSINGGSGITLGPDGNLWFTQY